MEKCLGGAQAITFSLVATFAWTLASCDGGSRKATLPAPESEQVISEAMKDLYMTAAAAAPHSLEQQKLILRMAKKASNGKELLLVMRAASGVFSSTTDSGVENRVRSTVTAKMMQLATLDQLIEYAAGYSIGPESARPVVERLFWLGDQSRDAGAWYRIREVASGLKVSDLEQQAKVRADQLAGR